MQNRKHIKWMNCRCDKYSVLVEEICRRFNFVGQMTAKETSVSVKWTQTQNNGKSKKVLLFVFRLPFECVWRMCVSKTTESNNDGCQIAGSRHTTHAIATERGVNKRIRRDTTTNFFFSFYFFDLWHLNATVDHFVCHFASIAIKRWKDISANVSN